VVPIEHKQDVMAENSTVAEIDVEAYLGKILRWLVLFMSNLGLPFKVRYLLEKIMQQQVSLHTLER
jgi:hypothetical protein